MNKLILVIAILLAPMLFTQSAFAASAIVTHLSGTLSAKKADGSVRLLAQKSEVDAGDTLYTEEGSYARLKFSDGGEMTLRPGTSLKIDAYGFDEAKPEQDNLVYSLLKGGLRTITGLISKRGNRDAYRLNTATATIGIRGTQFLVFVCNGNCQNLPDGVYVEVLSGMINVKNDAGEQDIGAGQWGFIGSLDTKPQLLNDAPGLSSFSPPFDSSCFLM